MRGFRLEAEDRRHGTLPPEGGSHLATGQPATDVDLQPSAPTYQ
jgi:hypothetical protein